VIKIRELLLSVPDRLLGTDSVESTLVLLF
jgi:hypothetical protein